MPNEVEIIDLRIYFGKALNLNLKVRYITSLHSTSFLHNDEIVLFCVCVYMCVSTDSLQLSVSINFSEFTLKQPCNILDWSISETSQMCPVYLEPNESHMFSNSAPSLFLNSGTDYISYILKTCLQNLLDFGSHHKFAVLV